MNSTMSEEAINKRNEMFREVHPAEPATHEKTFVTVDESVYREAMTLKDVQRKNEETVNALFEKESKQDEIGSVFEKPQYPDLKEGLTKVKGIDQKVLDDLKNQVDKLDNNKKEAELKNRDEATMSGPVTRSSFGDLK